MNEEIESENVRIHSRADELIACLEGEIAKRDAELAACRVAVENCEVFRARIAELEDDLKCAHSMLAEVSKAGMALRAELSAIKAQEPVTVEFRQFMTAIVTGAGLLSCGKQSKGLAAELSATAYKYLLAAPVSEAKAQGVVMQSTDGGRNPRYEGLFDGETEEQRASRLNATPVQQVSVPDGWRLVKVGIEGVQFGNAWFSHEGITGYTADQLNSGNCRITGRAYMDWLAAAPAAPAADAGLVDPAAWLWAWLMTYCKSRGLAPATQGHLFESVSDMRAALAAHRAKGVV